MAKSTAWVCAALLAACACVLLMGGDPESELLQRVVQLRRMLCLRMLCMVLWVHAVHTESACKSHSRAAQCIKSLATRPPGKASSSSSVSGASRCRRG